MLPQPSLERACVEVLCLTWFQFQLLILFMCGVQTTWSWVPLAVSTSGCLRCPSPTLAILTSSRPRPPRSKLPFDFLIINWDTQRSVSRLWRKKETDRHAPIAQTKPKPILAVYNAPCIGDRIFWCPQTRGTPSQRVQLMVGLPNSCAAVGRACEDRVGRWRRACQVSRANTEYGRLITRGIWESASMS